MERDLASILDKSPLEYNEALALITALARALGELHQRGEQWDQSELGILIGDDGHVSQIGTTSQRIARLGPGKLDVNRDFVAPEYAGTGQEDFRSDIWAWGSVAYEAVTGIRPFTGETVIKTMTTSLKSEAAPPHEINHDCTKILSAIIAKALKKDPNDRYQSAEELLQALHDAP